MSNTTVDSSVEEGDLGMIPSLVAIAGPLRSRTLYLDKIVVSVGRKSSNDIRLEDWFVSRHHCLIRNEGEQYMIEDLNSANGTYLNGERVRAGSLKEGSLIEIGASGFLFKLQDSESIASSQNPIGAKNVSDGYAVISGPPY
jgi:pSer/pThr/pTyr-binding forkhead associated (FHA) protein